MLPKEVVKGLEKDEIVLEFDGSGRNANRMKSTESPIVFHVQEIH